MISQTSYAYDGNPLIAFILKRACESETYGSDANAEFIPDLMVLKQML